VFVFAESIERTEKQEQGKGTVNQQIRNSHQESIHRIVPLVLSRTEVFAKDSLVERSTIAA